MRRALLLFAVLGLVLGGRVAARAQTMFTASLDTTLETLLASSKATGTAWAILSADNTTLTYGVTYANLSANRTGAHFHVGRPGVNGPVVHPITFSGNTAFGTWSALPDSIVRDLYQGIVYVNVHSSVNPAGEIRGQLHQAQGVGFSINLDAAQEGSTLSNGTGTGWAVLDTSGQRVLYRITVAGLDSDFTAAHFHLGAPGVPGGVVHPIAFQDSTATGVWTGPPDSLIVPLLRGGLYANVHTRKYPGGEIRGQVLPAGDITFLASMDANQEGIPSPPPGQGTIWLTLRKDLSTMTYGMTFAELTGRATAAHFHVAPAGISGPVVVPIPLQGNSANHVVVGFPDSLARVLVQNRLYANVHTASHPGGEIRGQLRIAKGSAFVVHLDGSQVSPPVLTGAQGTGWAVIDSTGNGLDYRVTVAGLSDSLLGARFHAQPSGPPAFIASSAGDSTFAGAWPGVPDSLLFALFHGSLYMSVASKAHPGGEIAGTFGSPAANTTGVEASPKGIPVTLALAQNYPNPFNPSTTIEFSLPKEGRVSLKVFNVLGQEVATLLNDTKAAGTYRLAFRAGNLSSGVYFYRLTSDAGISLVKKMLLVK